MANDSKQQLQVEVKPEVSKGAYSNLALIAHSPSEVVIDFAAMLPGVTGFRKPVAGAACRRNRFFQGIGVLFVIQLCLCSAVKSAVG